MKCAVNFAFANRLMLAHLVRGCFEKIMSRDWHSMGMRTVYNVAHNICKLEVHGDRELYVHRKGATRAFGPGAEGVPGAYREVGQPVLIAGSMGTASYILVGTEKAMIETYGSTCHGAGRTMSRTAAMKKFHGNAVKQALDNKNISARATHPKVLAEEAPQVYKDVDEVVHSVDGAGISTMVARMVPVAVMKG
jgi:tRNA-splicing ligase RtcB